MTTKHEEKAAGIVLAIVKHMIGDLGINQSTPFLGGVLSLQEGPVWRYLPKDSSPDVLFKNIEDVSKYIHDSWVSYLAGDTDSTPIFKKADKFRGDDQYFDIFHKLSGFLKDLELSSIGDLDKKEEPSLISLISYLANATKESSVHTEATAAGNDDNSDVNQTVGSFIGRFQAVHNGHLSIIETIASECDKIIILVGSVNRSRSYKNPFSYSQVEDMLKLGFADLGIEEDRYSICPLNDTFGDMQEWSDSILNIIYNTSSDWGISTNAESFDPIIYGAIKDPATCGASKGHSSFYLDYLSNIFHIREMSLFQDLHSTDVRHQLLLQSDLTIKTESIRDMCPDSIASYLLAYSWTAPFSRMKREASFVSDFMAPYRELEFPPWFVTADNVVVKTDRDVVSILMITRKGPFGDGLLALPGCYTGERESFIDSAIRELLEKTHLDAEEIEPLASWMADDPGRCPFARSISQIFIWNYDHFTERTFSAGDDVAKCEFVSIKTLMEDTSRVYLDHMDIIHTSLSILTASNSLEYTA